VSPEDAVVLDQNECRPYQSGGSSSAPDYYDRLITINAGGCPGPPDGRLRLCFNGVQFSPGGRSNFPALFQMIRGDLISPSLNPLYTPNLNEVNTIILLSVSCSLK
jgi:hypothetical protein